MKNKKTYQYPWRFNNKFQVLVDGADFFASMLDEIKKSKTSILLESYLFESGKMADVFIEELCKAKNRGVNVSVLLDEYGAKSLSEQNKNEITSCNIQLTLYNPVVSFHFSENLKRDHRKLLIVDDHIAFIGGAGITDEFSPDVTSNYWHDVMLKINGDTVLDLSHSFKKITSEHKNILKPSQQKTNNNSDQKENKARILISSGTERNEIIRSVINQIRTSKEKVWLTSPYFISSWKIRRALRYAAKKGVDVRLVFPGPHSDHKWITYGIQRYYQRLLNANIMVYEYQPRFTHAKIILCDNWFTIGSSNFDRWNQFLNLDANIEIYDEHSHQQIVSFFEHDFSKSSLIIAKKWNSRSFFQKMKEWVSGIVITGLGFISRKFKR
jgi:cardiolipin synthase